MKNVIVLLVFILFSALAFSCKNEPKNTTEEVKVGKLTYNKTGGADCDQPDTLRTNCAVIDLSWPNVEQGSEALKTNVKQWADTFLVNLIVNATYDSSGAKTLEEAVQGFLTSHAEWSKEAPGSPLGAWEIESSDTTLLNDGKHLTLQMNAYLFTGGAHGGFAFNTATFDVATGKRLTWADLVTDEAALKTLAEKKFREVRADIFQPGEDGSPDFEFGEIFAFQLPINYGLTDQGIYFHYDPYEVTPYALGMTDFVLTFEELGTLKK